MLGPLANGSMQVYLKLMDIKPFEDIRKACFQFL
jgi:hypothetical protein